VTRTPSLKSQRAISRALGELSGERSGGHRGAKLWTTSSPTGERPKIVPSLCARRERAVDDVDEPVDDESGHDQAGSGVIHNPQPLLHVLKKLST
jgi:hypothetical protein